MSSYPYLLFWIILTLLLVWQFSFSFTHLCLALSIFLLYSHILYGGYYIVSSENKTDYIVVLIAPIIFGGLGVMAYFHAYPLISYSALIILFLFAILFHRYYASKLTHVCFQEFCHYKMFIEVYGIILSLIGIVSSLLFPALSLVSAVVGVYFVLRLNWLIFIKKDLYRMRYNNPILQHHPLISIVLTADPQGHGLETVLTSIQQQTYTSYEVILIGDAHMNLIKRTAEKFLHRIPLRMVQPPVGCPARSRNVGASEARGELILFLDTTVVLPSEFLEKSMVLFSQDQLSIAGFDLLYPSDKKQNQWINRLFRFWLRISQYYHPHTNGNSLMVLRSLHERIRFDETITMLDNEDYVTRASAYGKYRFISELQVSVSDPASKHPVWKSIQNLMFEIYRYHVGEIRFSHAPSSGKKEGSF